jgi:small subunit ribosomal protein S5
MAFRNNNIEEKEFSEYLVALNRVSKTVKGGRVARFAAIMVVGDGHGRVGVGLGKAVEVPEAIRKGIEDAKKNMVSVAIKGTTIPHEVVGVFGAGKVLLKPAAPGTGIIAGNKVRMVLEAAGISNIRAKCLRSNNPINVVKATMAGLMQLRTAEEVAATRGITVDDVKGGVQK